ncbi:MAG: glycosyltransferase family 4 protein [Bryobacteraceae bacterium]
MTVGINCRFEGIANATGVQRYARMLVHLLASCGGDMRCVALFQKVFRGYLPGILWEHFRLEAAANARSVDLVHHPGNTAPAFATVPFVLTIHDVSVMRHSGWYSSAFAMYYRLLLPVVARRARRILTVSEFSRREIVETLHVPESRIDVVGNAVTAPAEVVLPKRSRPYLLAVGSISPRKNLVGLLQAFPEVRRRTGVDLVVVGSTDRFYAKARLPAVEGVFFVGRVPDAELYGFYRSAAAFVFPSFYEGFGIPLLEAFHCGAPVACSGTTGLKEIAGDATATFDPSKSDEISAVVVRIIEDSAFADMLRKRGIERLKVYSAQSFLDAHLRSYQSAMGSG